jgi:hypothetical protein
MSMVMIDDVRAQSGGCRWASFCLAIFPGGFTPRHLTLPSKLSGTLDDARISS